MYDVKEIGKDGLESIASYEYWNDESEEVAKEWDVRDGNFDKMESYLDTSGLKQDLLLTMQKSGLQEKKGLCGIELASGVCWTAPYIFSQLSIEKMFYLDFSYHRIGKIAPQVLEHYKIPAENVSLIRGDFYNTGLPDSSLDFVLLAQAFHHAYEPEKLLAEISRILKDEGMVLIIGEPIVKPSVRGYLHILKERFMKGTDVVCLNIDEKLGDHYYPLSSYKKMFRECEFQMKRLRECKQQAFILKK